MTVYLAWMYLLCLAVGYVVSLAGATLLLGRSLSETGSPTGFQDAVTPPRSSTITLGIYAISVGSLIYGVWRFGFLRGIGILVAFGLAVVLNRRLLLPKPESPHFRGLILRSMIGRHADYIKAGDTLRAAPLGSLLAKMGLPVDEFVERLKGRGEA